MKPLSFKRHRFPPDIIRHAIWLYARFTLSFRDVEEMLAERGLDVGIVTLTGFTANFGNPPVATLCGFNGLANAGERRNRPILD